jgi:hypothetical protein
MWASTSASLSSMNTPSLGHFTLSWSATWRSVWPAAGRSPDDLPLALGVRRHGDYRRDRDDAATLALLEVGGIEPEIGPFAGQRTVQEGADAIVDVLA